MKRENILLFTLLLTQSTSVLGWNPADEAEMNAASNGQQRLSVKRKGFANSLSAAISTLDPSTPLPTNLGTAKQRVMCTFQNGNDKNEVEVLLPTEYPLQAQWLYEEQRDNKQNKATLKIRALVDNQLHDVFERAVDIQHTLLDPGTAVPGRNYFDGESAYQAHTILQRWENPQSHQSYLRTIATRDNDLQQHKGNQVIYVEPFELETTQTGLKAQHNVKPKDVYRGEYEFLRDLKDLERLSGHDAENLIYSSSGNLYRPHVTQELWKQGQNQTGFFIASYAEQNKVKFIDDKDVELPNGALPTGLYKLIHAEENPLSKKRTESWQKLGDNPEIVNITRPSSHRSTFTQFIENKTTSDNMGKKIEIKELKEKISEGEKSISKQLDIKDVENTVLVIGGTGAGKSTILNYLAGNTLSIQKGPKGFILDVDTKDNNIKIGHKGSETKVPNSWYDQTTKTLYFDCPGFDDTSTEQDILNAFYINKLFTSAKNPKILFVFSENQISERALPLISTIEHLGTLFPDLSVLEKSISCVFTKKMQIEPRDGLKELQSDLSTLKAKQLVDLLMKADSKISEFPHAFVLQMTGSKNIPDTQKADILTSVKASTPLKNTSVNISVSDKALLAIGDLEKTVKDELETAVKENFILKIAGHCDDRVYAGTGGIEGLKTYFSETYQLLNTIAQEKDSEKFFQGLYKIADKTKINFDVEKIKENKIHLDFFKKTNNNFSSPIEKWQEKIVEIRGKVDTLSRPSTGVEARVQNIRRFSRVMKEERHGDFLFFGGGHTKQWWSDGDVRINQSCPVATFTLTTGHPQKVSGDWYNTSGEYDVQTYYGEH